MPTPEQVRRVPRYMNWSERPPHFVGMHGVQQGAYELGAFDVDRFGKKLGGGLVGTFRDLDEARVAARAMNADHPNFDASIHIDPDDRFVDHALGDAGDMEGLRIEYRRRRQEHYTALERQPKIANPFSAAWPKSDPKGEFIVSARRIDQKSQPRKTVARFVSEAEALVCHDKILVSNNKWEPQVKVEF